MSFSSLAFCGMAANPCGSGKQVNKAPSGKIILVSGIIDKKDKVELSLPFTIITGGKPDDSSPGDYCAQMLDENGLLLDETGFGVDFRLMIETRSQEPGTRETSRVPLTLKVNLPEKTSKIAIVNKQNVLAEVSSKDFQTRDEWLAKNNKRVDIHLVKAECSKGYPLIALINSGIYDVKFDKVIISIDQVGVKCRWSGRLTAKSSATCAVDQFFSPGHHRLNIKTLTQGEIQTHLICQ